MAPKDLIETVALFRESHSVGSVGIMGWGAGGLIATRALEAAPAFDAALAFCAPIGSAAWQLSFLLDFALVANSLFPRILLASSTAQLSAFRADPPKLLNLHRCRPI